MHEMIGREGVQLHRQLGPPQWGQLVGVEVDPPVEGRRVGKDGPRLLDIEDPLLAEHVHRLGEAPTGDLRVDLLDQPADKNLRVLAMLGRDLVGRQTGGEEVDWMGQVRLSYDLQHPDLGLQVESVARLGLDGGGSVLQEGVEAGQGAREKFVGGGLPGRAHGGVDTASRRGDVHIARTPQPPVELVLP